MTTPDPEPVPLLVQLAIAGMAFLVAVLYVVIYTRYQAQKKRKGTNGKV